MKIVDYKDYKEKQQSPGWFLTFFTGIILGGFVVWWNKDKFVQDSYFLGEEIFKRFGYTSIYKEGFFYYIFKNRFELFLLLTLSSFTSFMGGVFYFFIFWFGLCGGVIGITLLIKFGIKGILLLFGLIFPHILIYVPCFVGLMKFLYKFQNAGKISRSSTTGMKYAGNRPFPIFLLTMLCFLIILLTGVLVESYVNPLVLKKITSFFL